MTICQICGSFGAVTRVGDRLLCRECAFERERLRRRYVGPERRLRGRNLTGIWRRWDDRPRLGTV